MRCNERNAMRWNNASSSSTSSTAAAAHVLISLWLCHCVCVFVCALCATHEEILVWLLIDELGSVALVVTLPVAASLPLPSPSASLILPRSAFHSNSSTSTTHSNRFDGLPHIAQALPLSFPLSGRIPTPLPSSSWHPLSGTKNLCTIFVFYAIFTGCQLAVASCRLPPRRADLQTDLLHCSCQSAHCLLSAYTER